MISPDLTLNDKRASSSSGGLTPDNIGVEYAGVVFAIAESPLEKGVIWAGTNDGQVQITRDAGEHVDERHGEHSRPAAAGARSATSSRRASTPAPPTSPSTCTR